MWGDDVDAECDEEEDDEEEDDDEEAAEGTSSIAHSQANNEDKACINSGRLNRSNTCDEVEVEDGGWEGLLGWGWEWGFDE